MSYEALKAEVHRVNLALVDAGLVKLTWGNASGVDVLFPTPCRWMRFAWRAIRLTQYGRLCFP